MRKLMTLAPLLVALAGCDDGPSSRRLEPCELDHFGTLVVGNATNIALEVIVDGLYYGLAPSNGGRLTLELAPGQHTVETFIVGTNLAPCDGATPILAECGTLMLCCAPPGRSC